MLRTTRPAATLRTEHGTYIATTRFAFPDDETGEVKQLPVMHPCEIFKDKTVVSEDEMDAEEVSEPTEYTFEEGYKRIEGLQKDALWRLEEEGRLRTRVLLMSRENRYEPSDPMYNDARNQPGFKNRAFMWLDE